MAESGVRSSGNLQRIIRKGMRASGVDELRVGFFATARYPDGTPVAQVAMINEYGAPRAKIPERPFFRQALIRAEGEVLELVLRRVDAEELVVDARLADEIGALLQGRIQERIKDLREPPNAPSTQKRKGSANPLVDTGTMRTAVTWQTRRK